MDFYRITERPAKNGIVEISPSFIVVRSADLMVRGQQFYAIWDETKGLWSTDEYDVPRLIDKELWDYKDNRKPDETGSVCQVKTLANFSSTVWTNYKSYISKLTDSYTQLDESLTFANSTVKKEDFVSKRLNYALQAGEITAYDELMSVLYDPEERAKIEWAIGAIIAGDAKHIQKFVVFYGPGGTGKSTVLEIIQKLFKGYYTTFEAKALTSNNNAFATEVFKGNPLVAIQHDGDLSKIEDNSKLNAIVAHEYMTFNEKFKPSYDAKVDAFLFMGTNKPVKITDAKSGLIRRLIDVHPTGQRVSPRKYQTLTSQINFELGAIAQHCLDTYREMGKDYYSGYKAVEMMLQTNMFFNFIEYGFDIFKKQDGTSLSQAYALYKEFCEDSLIEYPLKKPAFRDELANYFDNFEDRGPAPERVRSWYSGFKTDQFRVKVKEETVFSLVLDQTESVLDLDLQDCPAQYATKNETPIAKWDDVTSKLSDISTHELHYVKPPVNHIVIDFDLKGDDGTKSAERNLEAANQWPSTYAEYSKGGSGIHLHYNYDGDANELRRIFDTDIEVKVFNGNSSLRRKLSRCNNVPVATLSGGLPLKEKKVINSDTIKSEKSLRDLIDRNFRKEIHAGTKPSMDFMHKILEDAYKSGMSYDLTDIRPRMMAFANNSSNQSAYCLKLMTQMKFKSDDASREQPVDDGGLGQPEFTGDSFAKFDDDGKRIVIFDVEVFPNLFVISWKYHGSDQVQSLVNPTAQQVEGLLKFRLVGFNNRKYDNHILYAAYMGADNEKLYRISKKIIDNVPGAMFGEAYNLSYADIFDFSSKKQGLKKFQIELGLHHQELGLPWDEPVPEEKWPLVVKYCENDVRTTEPVFDDRAQDFVARQILADISGLSVNTPTNTHTTRIIFGDNRKPQDEFNYTELATGSQNHPISFPGYEYKLGKSTYKGETVGEGGYVYSEPGMYSQVAVLDVTSMHPTSIIQLELFGKRFTSNFAEILNARVAIKRGDYDTARKMFNGKLEPYLKNKDDAEKLAFALKIVINSVYGLTAAKFDNPFRDKRNKDNIVAKRGALFMIDLKLAVQEKGYQVVHIKTDSIKIPNATQEIIDFVMDFGDKYGYEFEHENTYEKFCLVNDAVYVAKTTPGRKPAYWETTGAQFQHPFVRKTLFTKETIEFRDMCETKNVTTALYLDPNGVIAQLEESNKGKPKQDDIPDDGVAMALDPDIDAQKAQEEFAKLRSQLRFVGKTGSFAPMLPGTGGGALLREKDGKFSSATGAKGYEWMEAEMVQKLGKDGDIDQGYFHGLVDAAIDKIKQFGDFEWFVSEDK